MNYYFIYKGSGGLIHMLLGLVYSINYCITYKNILIIDVISHSCYKHYLSDFFSLQISEQELTFSENYDIIEPNVLYNKKSMEYIKNYPNIEVDIGDNHHKYLIDKINIRRRFKKEDAKKKIKIYAGPGRHQLNLLIKYIKVKPEIINIIKEKPIIDNYIGVHYRNTDIKTNINSIINNIIKYKYNNIYLATDDATAYDKIKLALPNHNIYQYSIPIDSKGQPIHYYYKDKYNLVLNLLTDIYFLYNSNEFIQSEESLVSRLILEMRKEKISIFD